MSELQRANDARLKESTQPTEQGRFLRAEFVASDLRRGGDGEYEDQKKWEEAKVHMLKELHLRLHEGSEVQKLQLCTDEDLKGVPPETIVCTTMKLERDEKVIGFRMSAVQSQAGSTVYFNVHVVLESKDGVRAEPLSREQLRSGQPDYPGRQLSLESKGSPKLEICELRSIRGQHRDHVLGPVYQSWHGIEGATGKDAMFWMELMVLTGGLYYLDVVTDVQQIALFLAERQYEYFALSCLGVAIPMVATVMDAVKWSEGSVVGPQSDAFRRSLPSASARLSLIFMSVLTQCHMILLVLASMHMRIKHDLLLGAKHAEVAEAVISAGLQTNFWFLIVVGMESVSSEDFQSLTFSIGISLASLAFGFAGRDRNDARVLGVPGMLGWEPIFIALFVVRAFEVTSRLLAFNMLHLATRTSLPLGGPVAVGVLVAWAYFAFPEAEKVHVFAAAIAHPGQVMLGNRSRIPLRFSLAMHIFLQVAAVALQGLVHFSDTWLPEAKEVPWPIIAASVAASVCSSIGLCALALYGNSREHPFLKMVAGGKRLTCTMLATAVELPQVPVAVCAMAQELWLDLKALQDAEILQKLALAQTRVCISASSMRELEMLSDERWALLKHLKVINVDFGDCTFEDACDAGVSRTSEGSQSQNSKQAVSRWASLRWTQLESVCFGLRANAEMLDMVARCHQLTEMTFWNTYESLGTVAWEDLPRASWTHLRVAKFEYCFNRDSQSQIAVTLLQVLATCQKLEKLTLEIRFEGAEAWEQIRKELCKAEWPEMRCVQFGFYNSGSQVAAVALLQCLAKSSKLEELNFWIFKLGFNDFDGGFDGASLDDVEAWEQIREAKWPALRRAAFEGCFQQDDSQGVAHEVLRILARCSELEVLNFQYNQWPKTQEWDEQFAKRCWPKLRWEKCDFGHNSPSEEYRPQQAAPATAEENPATAESELRQMSGLCGGCFCVHVPAKTEGEQFPKYLTHVGEVRGAAQLQSLAERPDLEVVRIQDGWELPDSAWSSLEKAIWPELRVASFYRSLELAGAHAALGLLARCKLLEELDLSFCKGIPAEAWERLRGAEWPFLKKADFSDTFTKGAPGCGKAAMLLEVLRKCSQLVKLEFYFCEGISTEDFKQLPDGCWPHLEKVLGMSGLQRLCRLEEPAADNTAIPVLEKETETDLQGPEGEIADNEDDVADPEKAPTKVKKKKRRWVTKTKAKRKSQTPPAGEGNLPA